MAFILLCCVLFFFPGLLTSLIEAEGRVGPLKYPSLVLLKDPPRYSDTTGLNTHSPLGTGMNPIALDIFSNLECCLSQSSNS